MTAPKLTKIELFQEEMLFYAGHFTIFSATERENLHGHNYSVYASLEAEVTENGMTCDYSVFKKMIVDLCQTLNEAVLLPTKSPYLTLEKTGEYVYACFNYGQEKIPFLPRDVKMLPVRNTTLEELSAWFLRELVEKLRNQIEQKLFALEIKISSTPGISGASVWRAI